MRRKPEIIVSAKIQYNFALPPGCAASNLYFGALGIFNNPFRFEKTGLPDLFQFQLQLDKFLFILPVYDQQTYVVFKNFLCHL